MRKGCEQVNSAQTGSEQKICRRCPHPTGGKFFMLHAASSFERAVVFFIVVQRFCVTTATLNVSIQVFALHARRAAKTMARELALLNQPPRRALGNTNFLGNF
jgi:hypothetical protein